MLFSLELQSAELILNRLRVAGSLCAWIWKHTTKPRTNPRATTNQTNTSVVSDLNPTRKWVAELGLGYCRLKFAALVLGWKQSEISERARKRAQMESGWGGGVLVRISAKLCLVSCSTSSFVASRRMAKVNRSIPQQSYMARRGLNETESTTILAENFRSASVFFCAFIYFDIRVIRVLLSTMFSSPHYIYI